MTLSLSGPVTPCYPGPARSSIEAGRPELRLLFDRERAARQGLSALQPATLAGVVGGGTVVNTLEDGRGNAVDLRLPVCLPK
ncbi:MAG: hypothetical protein AB1556_14585 [Bacillota bacterium]